MEPSSPSPKTRDAGRSRELLLDAAEALFSERGYDGVSLSEIAAVAGLSRGTPNYFFGSKEQLYRSVLERVFADRQAATAEAIRPVVQWCDGDGDAGALRRALAAGMEGYMLFLIGRPAFPRFITWEDLAGGHRLRQTDRRSTALEDAFSRVRSVARQRGLGPFRVEDAVLLFVSLTFSPLAHSHTFMVALGRDLSEPQVRKRHIKLAVEQMMHLLGAAG
ncbi:MAG TPA: TetR/AcrR family transcriptional regulator [Solirubrobacteraceae bacterium]|nr:TetR/AcrR family transcriptional regulator [Solirubrobacteraceae bacterium]